MPATKPSTIKIAALADLARSGLDQKDFTKLKITPHDERKTKTITEHYAVTSYQIPYFNFDGKLDKYFRLRFLDLPLQKIHSGRREKDGGRKEKELRYWQPAGTLPRLYLSPSLDWKAIAADDEAPLYITEGEKKAARACKSEIPCIGLGGVWSWRAAKKGVSLIDDFKPFKFKNRTVIIVFDSDVHEKQEVQHALFALGKELVRLGAIPYTIKLPSANGDKVGLDDYLEFKGEKEFFALPREQLLGELGEQLWALNNELAYIEESEGVLKFRTLSLLNKQTLVSMSYSNRLVSIADVNGGMKQVSVVAEWLKWPHRRTHRRIAFAPGEHQVTEHNEFNLWRGWGVEPVKGDCTPWAQLLEYIFASAPEHKRWFLQWLAYPLQHPGAKLYTASVLFSLTEGVGKSLIGVTMGRIYGGNYAAISGKELHGGFNEWGANKQFVLGDDVTGSDRRSDADLLKFMVTREQITIDVKYQPKYTVNDRINYLFTTNQPDAFFMSNADRRYFVHEITAQPLPDEFYKRYDAWVWSEEGPAALFHHLLNNIDCTNFNPKAGAPLTQAKAAMIEMSRSEVDNWAVELKEMPDNLLQLNNIPIRRIFWTTQELLAFYDPLNQKRSNLIALSKALRRAGFAPPQVTYLQNDEKTVKLWAIRDPKMWGSVDHHQRVQQYLSERPLTQEEKKAKF